MLQMVFTLTIFLNALLLFLVQPLFARMALPLLGGAPAVWNTALVFYQASLLLGYAWAHLSTRWFGMRRQPWIHLGLMATVFLALPIGIHSHWKPPTSENPIPSLLAMMSVSVGLPFFVVSSGSPLLQKWFANTPHKNAADPYFLYAASNAGSLISLLAYPFLLEPNLTLQAQSQLWSIGFGVLVACTALCALLLLRSARTLPARAESVVTETKERLAPARILYWVALAFVPTSLMSGVTTYLSTDVAAVPLLWVVPLALFLLTFIFAFAIKPPLPLSFLRKAFPIAVVALTLVLCIRATQPLPLLVGLHLVTFFLAALLCHSQLAADRPTAAHLTTFYLWISVGGVLGGAFNALVAPVIFSTVLEYPLTLICACFLLPSLVPFRFRWGDALSPVAVGGLTVVLGLVTRQIALQGQGALALTFGLPVLLCFLASQKPLRFGLTLGAVLLTALCLPQEQGHILYTERSFFGVNRVAVDAEGRFTQLYHGNILHGLQRRDALARNHPTLYYAPETPIGQVFSAWRPDSRNAHIAVVGLGAGALAGYGKAGETWTFYEIDPVVARIAWDKRFFTFLSDSPAQVSVQLGDARLSLAQSNDQYDLMILDAYSSDAIPVHLLTREAFQIYRQHLRPGGVIALHISSAHLNLAPVVQSLARDAGMVCRIREEEATALHDNADGKTTSRWAVVADKPEDMGPLATDIRWNPPPLTSSNALWTDQYSSILPLMNWN